MQDTQSVRDTSVRGTSVRGTQDSGTARDTYDVVVVGGGTGGLAAALVLGRSRRRVLVVDAGEPRNAPSAHLQGYPSRDGMPPAAFLAEVRRETLAYGVRHVRDRVTAVERDGGGEFDVTLAGGDAVHARRLVVATGLVDELPEVPGVAERWGKDVLHCPYCHGWEVRDQPFGVLYSPAAGTHQPVLLTQWSKDVTLFLHTAPEDALGDDDWHRLAAAGVQVVTGEVAGLVVEDDRLTGVRLADGTVFPRTAFFVAPRPVPGDGPLRDLGAAFAQGPMGTWPVVDATGLTTVPGVWAVGNVTGFGEQVVHAAAAGYRAGATLNADLLSTDVEAAAARRRAGVFSPRAEQEAARSRHALTPADLGLKA